MEIHVFIISWPGWDEAARKIYEEIKSFLNRVHVIYSCKTAGPIPMGDDWIEVPNEFFFGRKFRACLDFFQGDVFFLIQADAVAKDWKEIIDECAKNIIEDNRVGIWVPYIDYSYWNNPLTHIARTSATCDIVCQTDGIVVAYSKSIIERLKVLDYECNNIGWGIDWVAICHAYSKGLIAVKNNSVMICHPKGSGYSHPDAERQMAGFLSQMSSLEFMIFDEINKYIDQKRVFMKCLRTV